MAAALRVGCDCGEGVRRHQRGVCDRSAGGAVNTENSSEIPSLPRPSHKCYLRAARRPRPGPQARAAGRREATSLDEAEHSSTLTDVMADAARVLVAECVSKVLCDPRAICGPYARDNARANDAQISRARREKSRHQHRGVSNPPGRPRGDTGDKPGGLLTPPLTARTASVGLRTTQDAVRFAIATLVQVIA
jgi:hypothetical protein